MNDAEYADEAVAKLERKFRKVYKQAEKDIKQKLTDFVQENKERESKWAEMVAKGEKTQAEFDQWKRTQLYAGKSWENQKKNISYALLNANNNANNMINGESIDVFAYGGNYAAYEFEDGFKVHIGFDVYDRSTVERLIRDDPKLLPPKKLDPVKDVRWNMKNITSQVAQGIIQGESINKVAKRLASVVPNRNEKQMRLHARTAMTAAHNAGRMERYKEAEAMDIKFKKVWLSTHDGRARDLHINLDEQAVKPEEPFEIDGYEIMYPGDPGAEPEMVYNCRCTMVTELDNYPSKYAKEPIEEPKSFESWLDQLIAEQEAEEMATPIPDIEALKKGMSKADYEKYYNLVNDNEYVRGLYRDYGNMIDATKERNGGYYNHFSGVHYSLGGSDGYFSTVAHEFGHAFDDVGKDSFNVNYSEIDLLNQKCQLGSGATPLFKRYPSSSDEYLAAMRKDKEILANALNDMDTRAAIRADDASAGLQDFADGLFGAQSKGVVRWGHGEKYYNRAYNGKVKGFGFEENAKQAYKELGFNVRTQADTKAIVRNYETASELWANQMSALTNGGKELEYMEKYAPNSIAALKDILKGRK